MAVVASGDDDAVARQQGGVGRRRELRHRRVVAGEAPAGASHRDRVQDPQDSASRRRRPHQQVATGRAGPSQGRRGDHCAITSKATLQVRLCGLLGATARPTRWSPRRLMYPAWWIKGAYWKKVTARSSGPAGTRRRRKPSSFRNPKRASTIAPTAATIGYHSSLRSKLTLTMGRRRYRSPQQMAAPTLQPLIPQEEGAGGCRKGAEIRAHPRGGRVKMFSGGRPSAGEVPHGLPPAEDPWSSGEPLATALPHRRRPGFRSSSVALECGARWGPRLAI